MNYNSPCKSILLLGRNLKKLRKKCLLSQKQLANNCDIEISQISRIERGVINTSVNNIFKIAKALNIEVKELFDF